MTRDRKENETLEEYIERRTNLSVMEELERSAVPQTVDKVRLEKLRMFKSKHLQEEIILRQQELQKRAEAISGLREQMSRGTMESPQAPGASFLPDKQTGVPHQPMIKRPPTPIKEPNSCPKHSLQKQLLLKQAGIKEYSQISALPNKLKVSPPQGYSVKADVVQPTAQKGKWKIIRPGKGDAYEETPQQSPNRGPMRASVNVAELKGQTRVNALRSKCGLPSISDQALINTIQIPAKNQALVQTRSSPAVGRQYLVRQSLVAQAHTLKRRGISREKALSQKAAKPIKTASEHTQSPLKKTATPERPLNPEPPQSLGETLTKTLMRASQECSKVLSKELSKAAYELANTKPKLRVPSPEVTQTKESQTKEAQPAPEESNGELQSEQQQSANKDPKERLQTEVEHSVQDKAQGEGQAQELQNTNLNCSSPLPQADASIQEDKPDIGKLPSPKVDQLEDLVEVKDAGYSPAEAPQNDTEKPNNPGETESVEKEEKQLSKSKEGTWAVRPVSGPRTKEEVEATPGNRFKLFDEPSSSKDAKKVVKPTAKAPTNKFQKPQVSNEEGKVQYKKFQKPKVPKVAKEVKKSTVNAQANKVQKPKQANDLAKPTAKVQAKESGKQAAAFKTKIPVPIKPPAPPKEPRPAAVRIRAVISGAPVNKSGTPANKPVASANKPVVPATKPGATANKPGAPANKPGAKAKKSHKQGAQVKTKTIARATAEKKIAESAQAPEPKEPEPKEQEAKEAEPEPQEPNYSYSNESFESYSRTSTNYSNDSFESLSEDDSPRSEICKSSCGQSPATCRSSPTASVCSSDYSPRKGRNTDVLNSPVRPSEALSSTLKRLPAGLHRMEDMDSYSSYSDRSYSDFSSRMSSRSSFRSGNESRSRSGAGSRTPDTAKRGGSHSVFLHVPTSSGSEPVSARSYDSSDQNREQPNLKFLSYKKPTDK